METRSVYRIYPNPNQLSGKTRLIHPAGEKSKRKILNSIHSRNEHNALVQLVENLHLKANTDMLTGLHSRSRGMELLNQACLEAKKNGTSLSILMLDIDHFKRVNDTYGHASGDEVLRQVSNALNCVLRENSDVFIPIDVDNSKSEELIQKSGTQITSARIGGEELMVILPISEAKAIIVAERLRLAIESLEVQREGMPNNPISVTVSIGISNNTIDRNNYPHKLLSMADKFLYLAKRNRRNQVVSYDRAEAIQVEINNADNYVI